MNAADSALFMQNDAGVLVPPAGVRHCEDAFEFAWHDILRDIQTRHFWSKGRSRFILHALRRFVRPLRESATGPLSAIDLGGGCGGWIRHVQESEPTLFGELALGDSAITALSYAGKVVGPNVARYQVDLLDLPWADRWDVVFMLDVLEHIQEDQAAISQVYKALRPGGCLFVTTPAFNAFRSYNDDLVHHFRRYVRGDFARLARSCGFELCTARYFMFFLSPLLLLSRLHGPDIESMTEEARNRHLIATCAVPPGPINWLLQRVFDLETPLGHWLPFPWGTSILAVLRKPA